MKKTRSSAGLILVLISGFVFGIMPGGVTLCINLGANKETLLACRYFALGLALLPFVLRQKDTFRLYLKNFGKILLLSTAGALTPLFLYSAYEHQSTGLTTTLHFLYPVFVMILERIFYKQKITRVKAICLALCAAGILLMMEPGASASFLGLLFTFICTVTWSLYILWMDHLRPAGISSLQMIFYVAINGSVILLAYALIKGRFTLALPPLGILAVAGFSLIVAVCGSLLFALGIRKTDAQTAAIASTLEPITSLVVGVAFLSEPLTWRSVVGSVLILAAVVMISLQEKKKA